MTQVSQDLLGRVNRALKDLPHQEQAELVEMLELGALIREARLAILKEIEDHDSPDNGKPREDGQ